MKNILKHASSAALTLALWSAFVPLTQAEEVQAILICPDGTSQAGIPARCVANSVAPVDVPEPAGIALVALGLVGLFLIRRKVAKS